MCNPLPSVLEQHKAYNTRSLDPCWLLPPFLLQFLKPTSLETPRDTFSSTECPLEGHLTAGKSREDGKMTCVSLHFPPSHAARHTAVDCGVAGEQRGLRHQSPPTFSLPQIPIHKRRDPGKSSIKHRAVYSGAKTRSFRLSQGSDERQRLPVEDVAQGLGSWVRTWGRQRSRV